MPACIKPNIQKRWILRQLGSPVLQCNCSYFRHSGSAFRRGPNRPFWIWDFSWGAWPRGLGLAFWWTCSTSRPILFGGSAGGRGKLGSHFPCCQGILPPGLGSKRSLAGWERPLSALDFKLISSWERATWVSFWWFCCYFCWLRDPVYSCRWACRG